MSDMGVDWLLIEPGLSGHHATYLERIVAAALERRIRPTVVLADGHATRSAAAGLHTKLPGAGFVHFTLPTTHERQDVGFLGLVRKELAYWGYFHSAYTAVVKSRPIDRVFLPYMDYCLYACGLRGTPFGETPFEGICMRPGFHYREMGVNAPIRRSDALKKRLFARALRIPTLQRLFTNDETLFLYAQRQSAAEWRKVQYLPDPADFSGTHTRESARKTLGIPHEAVVVLVYGSLDEQKGLNYLLQGVDRPGTPGNLVLLLAGECAEGTRALLKCSIARNLLEQRRLILLDHRITDQEEQMCFAASDISWLGYRDKYCMSGVLVKAVQARHWVIAAKTGLIHWYASRLEQIISVNVEIPDEVSSALRDCAARTGTPGQMKTASIFSENNWQRCAQLLFK